MPSRLTTPVVTVDTAKIHKVDTANAQSLHGMWMVFSKCADYMEEGRRLENLSWRLWTRETFCVEPATSSDTSVLPLLRQEAGDMPELSASVESAASDQAERIEQHIKRPKCDYKPAVVREDSSASLGRGKEKHITSLGLERMVMNIKEKKNLEPIAPPVMASVSPVVDITPRPSTPTPTPPSESTVRRTPSYPDIQQPNHSTESCSTTAPDCNDSDAANNNASDTSVSSSGFIPTRAELIKSPSIVRGFSPSHVSSSWRSQPKLAVEPSPAKTAQLKPTPFKKKGGMFTLGGSSGDDDESSFEDRMAMRGPHRSSLSDSLSKPMTAEPSPRKKVTSFKEQDGTIKPIKERLAVNDEDAIETEDEVSESAIEDEDSDWEDSVTESGRSSVEEREMFQRVDSRPNLVSRRSLLTMMMHQPTKMGAPTRSTPALQRSRMTSPNGPSIPASPPDDEDNLTMRGPGVPRSKPIIMKPAPQSVAHSPRTTRRNMLATELTESLRRHLLWERQQKSATANAFLKRRHTAHDMANLQEYPGPKGAQKGQTQGINVANSGSSNDNKDKDLAKTGSFNHYTDHGPWEYHARGW
ncbi:dsp1-1 [Aspergillus avenaceus]|uniref:Dsp1-1 n=1 Tax=Aspergillus avenaceus TaxID=36643 RepID=A0A5N6TXU5_ASPAV|nr:dsp1-1 [Aspergillus avenaceus]